MLSGISGFHSYYSMYPYSRLARSHASGSSAQVQGAAPAAGAAPVSRTAPTSGRVPVQPVSPLGAGDAGKDAERQEIQRELAGYSSEAESAQARRLFSQGIMDPGELAVRMRVQYDEPLRPAGEEAGEAPSGIEGVREATGEEKCETCENRKYQDGSDDMGVSFQTPTHIAPEAAAARVRGHEMEHVVREQAKAEREDREVISQSVTLKTGVCPECGKVYISGGNTRTVTAAKQEPEMPDTESAERRPFSAVA